MSGRPIDPKEFRRLMNRWSTGVSVLTAREDDRDFGMTVNALLSVSLEPPLLLVSLSNGADTTPVVERTGAFAVSFLAAGQRHLSERFAQTTSPEEKLRGVAVSRGPLGLAAIDGALGSMECRVRSVLPVADHRVIVGEAVGLVFGADGVPLIFYRSGYAQADGPTGLQLPPARATQ